MSTKPPRRASAPIVPLALGAILAGCGDDTPPPTPPRAYAQAPVPETGGGAAPLAVPRFTDRAEALGVTFTHHNGARGQKYLPETMGSGLAVFDADGDGRMDLYFADCAPWPWDAEPGVPPPTGRLFVAKADGTFEDRTAAAGLADPRFALGVAAADYDGDGDTDLFVTGVGPCALYRNDGGRFTDVAAAAGVAGEPWLDAAGVAHDPVWTAAAFLDYDGDGVLDLYACRYVRWSRETDVFTSMDGRGKAYTVPDRYPGDSGRLYRGRGDGTFEDRTREAGVWNDDAKALGVLAADLDGDGRTDLMVANDTQPNHLYLNTGDGRFREAALEAGVAYDAQGKARADMGVDAGPVDEDGAPAIVTGTFSREAVAFYRRAGRSKVLTFVDEAGGAGLSAATFPVLTFGVLLQDLDLDGRLDLTLANGHIEPTIQSVMTDITYAQRPQLFLNVGGGRFRDVSGEAGAAFGIPCVGRGLAWFDPDGDGDPDLVITANGGPARILRNDAPPGRRSLRLRLVGPGKNRDGLGAVVAVTAGGRTLRRERTGGGSYCSASEPALLFGLGTASAAERVVVRWPDRARTEQDLGPLEAGLWRVAVGEKPVRLGE